MTNELALTNNKDESLEAALSVSSSMKFMPRLKLCQSNAKEVQANKVLKGGYFALITGKDDVQDLGDSVDAWVLHGRAKALRTAGTVSQFFNPEHPEFKKIQAESRDSSSGSMFGPEFLVYLPDVKDQEGNQGAFATIFLSSISSQKEGKGFASRLNKAVKIVSKLIKTDKYSWFVPQCTDNILSSEGIDLARLEQAVEFFKNEPESEIETVEQTRDR